MSVGMRVLIVGVLTYRVSLSDMVVAVDSVWTRLERVSKSGVGGGEFWPSSVPTSEDESKRGASPRCTTKQIPGRKADKDAATGARAEEAREGLWRDSQGFLPVTLRSEQSTRPLSATLLGADWAGQRAVGTGPVAAAVDPKP
jgi:hypothetical protein